MSVSIAQQSVLTAIEKTLFFEVIMKKLLVIIVLLSLPQVASADDIVLSKSQLQGMHINLVALDATAATLSRKYTAEVVVPPTQVRIISAPQQGLIDVMHVAMGQEVKKGQVIAHLSSPDLVGLQGEYLQVRTKKKLAASALARDSELLKDGIIAQRRYLETQSAHEELSASLAEKRQALRLAGMNDAAINHLNSAKGLQSGMAIVSPIDGQIIEQMVSVGQRVDSAMPLYKIANLDPLWLEINVPIDAAMQLKKGMLVNVPKLHASGKVITVMRSVNKASQTMQVRAEVQQGAENLALGQFVEAEIQIQAQSQSFALPSAAIVRNGKQTVVFKQTAKGFESVPVTVVAEQGGNTLVQGDFSGQENIAVTGLAALKGSWLGLGGQ